MIEPSSLRSRSSDNVQSIRGEAEQNLELLQAIKAGEVDDPAADRDIAETLAMARGEAVPGAEDHEFWATLGRYGETPFAGEKSDDDLAALILSQHRAPQKSESKGIFGFRPRSWRATVSVAAAAMVLFVVLGPPMRGVPLVGRVGEVLSQLAVREHQPDVETQETIRAEKGRVGPSSARNLKSDDVAVHADPAAPVDAPIAVAERVPPPAQEEPAALGDQVARQKGSGLHQVPHRSAAELLKLAQEARASGRENRARTAYRRLVRDFPDSSEAKLVRISLGKMELGAGRAKSALRFFSDYLAIEPSGPLAEEAREGKIRAFAALGRRNEETAAIRDFLARHGGSSLRGRMSERLRELEANP
jgi:hypothetical protein